MADSLVRTTTCEAINKSLRDRIERVEKTADEQWDAINDLRKIMQKQAVQIAVIVGSVSSIVQFVSIIFQHTINRAP